MNYSLFPQIKKSNKITHYFRSMEELTVQYHPFASVPPVTPSSVAALSMTSTEAGNYHT